MVGEATVGNGAEWERNLTHDEVMNELVEMSGHFDPVENQVNWDRKKAVIEADERKSEVEDVINGVEKEMTYEETQEDFERHAVLEDPENYGVGEIKVVDGRNGKSVDELYEEYNGEYSKEYLEGRKEEIKITHWEQFREFIDSFGGKLRHARVCPAPEYSPFSLKNVKRANGDIVLDPLFIEEIKYMQQKGVSEINLVASFADNDKNGETTMVLPDSNEYVAMIDGLVRQVGDEGLIISIGNETNESMDSNPDGRDGLTNVVVSERVEPEEYGKFYREVVRELKEKYPSLKFCLAGTAFCAPRYTKEVLEAIGDDSLIDIVDFHPYRNEVDEVHLGEGETVRDGWKYGDYEDELKRIAEEHGARLIVGEVQFGGGESLEATARARENLREALERSARKGIKSNVWPRGGLGF